MKTRSCGDIAAAARWASTAPGWVQSCSLIPSARTFSCTLTTIQPASTPSCQARPPGRTEAMISVCLPASSCEKPYVNPGSTTPAAYDAIPAIAEVARIDSASMVRRSGLMPWTLAPRHPPETTGNPATRSRLRTSSISPRRVSPAPGRVGRFAWILARAAARARRHGPIGQLETAALPPHANAMTARWSDPGRLPVPPTGYVRAVNPVAGR